MHYLFEFTKFLYKETLNQNNKLAIEFETNNCH